MKTVSIDEAAAQFASLAELAFQGESVFIERDSQTLLLKVIPAMPMAPAGFYEDIYDEEYIKEAQRTEPHSIISPDP